MAVAGTYDVVVKSPMGDQKSTLTINPDGDSFTGQMAGGMPQRGCALQPQTRLGQGGRGAKPRDAHSRNGDHSATTGM